MEFLLLLLLPLFAIPGGSETEASSADDQADDVASAKHASSVADSDSAATNKSDWFDLGDAADSLDGLKGHDHIDGNGGNDTLMGGAGRDSLYGDYGDDSLFGGRDADLIDAGKGHDSYGSAFGEAGNDLVYGGKGNDALLDGAGADTLDGGEGRDILSGVTAAYDALADSLSGGDGADSLSGNNGDTLTGGQGDDSFVVYPGGAPVVISDFTTEGMNPDPASNGDLLLILSPQDQSIDLQDHIWDRLAANGVDHEVLLGEKVVAILKGPVTGLKWIEVSNTNENVSGWGTNGADVLNGTAQADFLHGLLGDDRITAKGGDDFVTDGEGNDLVNLGTGDDQFLGAEWAYSGPDRDDIHGGKGDDLIESQFGADTLHGDAGNDTLNALDTPDQPNPTADFLSGGTGDDQLSGDAGDTLAGDEGADVFHVGPDGLVTIEGFLPGADSLLLHISRSAAISFALSQTTDTLVMVDGQPTALLRGILPAEIPAQSVRAA